MISRRDILKAATGALSLTGLTIPLEKTLSQQLKEIGPIPEPLVRNVDNGFLGLQGRRLLDMDGWEHCQVVEFVIETGRIVKHKVFKHPEDGRLCICYDDIDGQHTPILTEEIYAPAPLWTTPLEMSKGQKHVAYYTDPLKNELTRVWVAQDKIDVCPMWEICNCHYPNRPDHTVCPTHGLKCEWKEVHYWEQMKEVWEELND